MERSQLVCAQGANFLGDWRHGIEAFREAFDKRSFVKQHAEGMERADLIYARGHTQGGTNLLAQVKTPRCPNLRQVKVAGDFEGVVTFGLGLRHKTGFRVFRLTGPKRLVVDVAH